MSKCFSVSIVLATLAMIPNAANACDAELIKAMRSIYSFSETTDISEAVRQVSCGTNESNSSVGINYTGSYGIVGLNQQGQDIATACAHKDKSFFQHNARQIAYSFVPETALAACQQGLFLTAKQSSDGNVISVRAVYIPSTTAFAQVQRIEVRPISAIDCGDPDLKAGTTLSPAGVSMLCERKTDDKFGIRLSTNSGDKEIFVPRKRRIELKPIIWDHYVGGIGDTNYFRCEDKTDSNNRIPYGEFIKCQDTRTCGREESESGYCASQYGTTAIFVDNIRTGIIKPYFWP